MVYTSVISPFGGDDRAGRHLNVCRIVARNRYIRAIRSSNGYIAVLIDAACRLIAVRLYDDVIVGTGIAVLTRQNNCAVRLLDGLGLVGVNCTVLVDDSRTGNFVAILVRYLAALRYINAAVRVDINRTVNNGKVLSPGSLIVLSFGAST